MSTGKNVSPAAQQSGAHGAPPASKVTGGIVGRFFGARKRDHAFNGQRQKQAAGL
jgi:hypothetical protein